MKEVGVPREELLSVLDFFIASSVSQVHSMLSSG